MGSYAVASYGGAPSATEQVTVTHTTGQGDAVVVLVGAGGSGVVSSVTDSQGNSYSLIASNTAQSIGLYAYQAYTNTPLVSGTDWIKVTYAGSATGQQWIARGMAGVSGFDVSATASSPSSGTVSLTSASPSQAAEWAIALVASGDAFGTGTAPASWTGGFTAQQTVQNGIGSFYTFADQITSNTNPLQPSASLSPSNKWELIVLSMKFTPIYEIGSANSTGTGTSLSIPVTTGTQPGDAIVIFAKQNSATVTSVTDSTGGNTYTVQQTNAGNSFDVTTITAGGITQVGAAYAASSYSGAGSRLVAGQELDTWLNGGGANWPTQKLSPRTMAFNVLREYYNTDPLMSAASTGWPTSSGSDVRNLATAQSNGVGNVCITFRPARDGTNNYSSGTYTTEKANLVSAISYIKSVFPKAKFCLWHEANAFSTSGPFGNGSSVPGLGSPYGSSVTKSQMHANWAAYVGFYGPAFQAAGADLYWVSALGVSPGEAIDFFDIALNATQQGYFTGIAADCYSNNFISNGTVKNTLTGGYGTNSLSALALSQKYGLPFSIWELGAGTGQSATDNVSFLDNLINAPLVNWIGQGNPVAEVLWFNYSGDVIGSAMDPSVLAAVQRLYDALESSAGATTAIPAGGTITVNWSAGANTKFAVAAGLSLASTGLPDQKVTAAGTSTAPSATTGTLAQANEVAFAYISDANGGGAPSWAGGWTVLASDHTGTSTFQSLAYQSVSSPSALTASATITSAAWDINLITFPVTSTALTSGVTAPKAKLSGTGSVSATPITGTGAIQAPKALLSSAGLGAPGTPYLIGSVSGSGTSLTVPVSANVNSGDSVQVGLVLASTASSPTVGPDTAGNVYTLVLASAAHNDSTFVVYQCDGANPLTQGVDSIPVTQTVSGTFGALAIGDNGVFSTDPNGVVAGAGSSTAPNSGATATLSQAEEHAIAWIVDAQAGGVPTWASPWSGHVLANVDANSTTRISAAYQIVSATTALTASGTITSADWAAGVTTNMVTPTSLTLVPSNGVAGVPYSQTLEYSGGQPPDTWAIVGSLPPGLALSGNVISGVPTTPGTYSFTIRATDSLGVQTNLAVTVEILFGATGAPPMTQLPNNLFSAADSDFEVQGWTWGARSNAAATFHTQDIAFTGNWALGWATLADGQTSIAAGAIPVTPGTSYILSGAILPAQDVGAEVGVTWLDISNNPIRTDLAASTGVAAGGWNPLQGAFTAPVNAVTATPVVQVEDSNAGDTTFIDMMFFAQAGVQVLVDWTNEPFGTGTSAGSAFMDVSPWVRLDGNGITFTRGRQDAISTIQPGSGSFDLQNDAGEFAADNSASLPVAFGGMVTLARRVQINVSDENGAWNTRFDGRIAEVDYDFDPTGNTSIASIALTDILSYLSQQDELFCWTKQQVLSDGPLYHWSLDDAGTASLASGSGAGVAVESSGNNGPPLRLVLSDSTQPPAAQIAWQDTSGGVETLADAASATGQDGSSFWQPGSNQPSSPLRGLVSGNVGPFTTPIGSVMFTPKQTTQSAQNTFIGGTGYMLTGALPTPIAPTATGSDYTIELWMMPDPSLVSGLALNNGPYIALGLGSGTTKTNLLAGIFLNSGTATIKCSTYSQPPSFLGLNFPGASAPSPVSSVSAAYVPTAAKLPHHLVITISGDPSAAKVQFILDGTQIGSGFTLPAGQTYDTICLGGAYGGTGAFFGNLSLASIYPYVLSTAQIYQHCQMGQYGMWEETTDDCIAQLADFSGVPSYWSNLVGQHAGLSMADYMDISGSNALTAMQQYELTEHGLLFGTSQGALNFHTRSWRMGYGAPDLLLPPGVFGEDLEYKIVSQFMTNEEGVSGPNTLGASATTLLANPATGQISTQTSASTVIQSGYVNTDSQKEYGAFATYPVSAPLSIPAVAWSRGFAALGLPSYSYWTDPSLDDRAAWDANSRDEPWAFPAQVEIDLLTLDPASGLGISDFYKLDIDNMLAPTPDTLPPSFPNAQTSVEWFIEGMTETITVNSHTLLFLTSPAEPQRAWIPGDATYGVLGETTRLGISTADTGPVQAYGKSVSHDAGGPYWPQSFSVSLNAPPSAPVPPGYIAPQPVGGFVGAADLRGIAQNLQAILKPPMCVVGAESQTQSFTNGALTGSNPPNIATLFWDQVFVDTAGGMGAVPGWPNWYLVTVAGYYEIDASIVMGTTNAQAGYTAQGWVVVAQSAAQAIAAGTGNPLTVNQYVRPIGEAVCENSASTNPIMAPTTRMYLGVGDMVCAAVEQNWTGSKPSGTGLGGSRMSIRFTGYASNDDRTLINTSLGSGGGVSLNSHGPVQQSSFFNTHTYTYQGKNGATPYARIFSDGECLQGQNPKGGSGGWGSRSSQVAFNVSAIQSALSGHTILSATLTATNTQSYYSTGARMLLGWTSDTPGKSKFNAQDSNTTSWVTTQWFGSGQTKTFSIPISLVQALKTGGGTAFVLGNSTNTSDPGNYGAWAGTAEQWILTVNYR